MPSSQSHLAAFQTALLQSDTHANLRNAPWARASTSAKELLPCPICTRDMGGTGNHRPQGTLINPLSLGGRNTHDNRLLACSSCVRLRGRLDLLDDTFLRALGRSLPASLVALREQALFHSSNHLTSLPPSSKPERFRHALSERFTHARARVFAHAFETTCFIGWVRKAAPSQAFGIVFGVVKAMGGADRSNEQAVLLEVPSAIFLDVVWALIELNELVLPLPSLGAGKSFDDDWRASWTHTFVSPEDNHRRHKRGQPRLPWPPKLESQTPSALYRRQNSGRDDLRRTSEVERACLLRERLDHFLVGDSSTRPPTQDLLELVRKQTWLMMTVEMRRAFNQRNATHFPLYP